MINDLKGIPLSGPVSEDVFREAEAHMLGHPLTEEQVELAHDVACNNGEGEEVLFPGLNRDLPHPVWLSLVLLLLWGIIVAGGLVCA